MRDLLARLARGDDDAAAALRVLDYFDALDDSSVGPEAYLRGACGLTECGAGLVLQGRRLLLRLAPDGRRIESQEQSSLDPAWPTAALSDDSSDVAWIETTTPELLHALTLERVAQGVRRWNARMDALLPDPAQAWTILLNDPVPPDRREQLFAALKLDDAKRYQVVAHIPAGASDGLHAFSTVQGVEVAAAIRSAPFNMDLEVGDSGRFGVGPAVTVRELLDSWQKAVVALRVARPGEALPWGRLGVLGPLFLRADTEELLDLPIVRAMNAANMPWLDQTVTAVTQTGSIRGAADLLHLHHSTVQKRIDRLQQEFHLNLDNARHVYHLWLVRTTYRFASFGTPANMQEAVRLTPRPFDGEHPLEVPHPFDDPRA